MYVFNPNLGGFLGVCFEVVGEKLSLCLELCQKLEIWYVSTHTYIVSENIPFSTKLLLILLMPAFFCEQSAFLDKNSTFTQGNSVRAM